MGSATDLRRLRVRQRKRLLVGAILVAMTASASANPLSPPTVPYIADFEITRDSDHSFQVPARYVFNGTKMRIELVGIVKLIDINQQNETVLIPRVRTWWAPTPLPKPIADARRFVGVEAVSAEPLGTETMLGRLVTKYRVRGTIFDVRTPFDGYVWTTAENIVLCVDGIGQGDGFTAPIKVVPQQLVVGPVDPNLLVVPSNYGRAGPGDVGWRQTE